MPTDALYLYKRWSADNGTVESLKGIGASPKCTSDVQELQCVAVYCSKDEKYLVTEYTKADCENTTKHCLIDPIEALIKAAPFLETQLRPSIENLEETCAVYPAGSNVYDGSGTNGSGNIQLVDCVVLLFSFIVVKLFA
ncbi:Hypothetical predicted protein [Paramuricea clavata]|uniref:Uncharacterized protein n=1 Tax=Paramuricea clavata TaxID=317549 RepID=A0A6S7H9Z2_PARCT|nr:Hypothetical predicted protein [Paramuricea clavata]